MTALGYGILRIYFKCFIPEALRKPQAGDSLELGRDPLGTLSKETNLGREHISGS